MSASSAPSLVNPLPYADADRCTGSTPTTRRSGFRFSVVDYRALEADHPAFSAVAAYQTPAGHRDATATSPSGSRAKSVTGSYFPLLGQTAAHRPAVRRLRRRARRSDRGADRTPTGRGASAAIRRCSAGRSPSTAPAHTVVGVLQQTSGPLEHDVAVFTAARWPPPRRKGPFFTDGRSAGCAPASRRRRRARHAARHQRAAVPDLEVVVPGRKSHLGPAGSEGARRRRRRLDARSSCSRRSGCVLLIACANAINLLIARASSAAASWRSAARSAPRAAGCCSTFWSKRRC